MFYISRSQLNINLDYIIFFQTVIWTNVFEETIIEPNKFSSALPTGPKVFNNSGTEKAMQLTGLCIQINNTVVFSIIHTSNL